MSQGHAVQAVCIGEDLNQIMVFADNPYANTALLGLKGVRWYTGHGKNPQKELRYKGCMLVSHAKTSFQGIYCIRYEPPFTAVITATVFPVSLSNAAQGNKIEPPASLEEFVNAFANIYFKEGGKRLAVWDYTSELYHSGIQS